MSAVGRFQTYFDFHYRNIYETKKKNHENLSINSNVEFLWEFSKIFIETLMFFVRIHTTIYMYESIKAINNLSIVPFKSTIITQSDLSCALVYLKINEISSIIPSIKYD